MIGARGSAGRGGSDWYIENIFEEVDSQNEYFFDTKTKTLYYFNNGTGSSLPFPPHPLGPASRASG